MKYVVERLLLLYNISVSSSMLYYYYNNRNFPLYPRVIRFLERVPEWSQGNS